MGTLRSHRGPWWLTRAFGRNPLVRASDRVEAGALLLGVAAAVIATVVALAAGMHVYRGHALLYSQTQSRRLVTASVVESADRLRAPHTNGVPVLALWVVDEGGARGGEDLVAHTGWIRSGRTLHSGELMDVWVDGAGLATQPPTPTWQAGVDAAGFTTGLWLVSMAVLAAAWNFVRLPLDRIRQTHWEAELTAADGSYRHHRPQP